MLLPTRWTGWSLEPGPTYEGCSVSSRGAGAIDRHPLHVALRPPDSTKATSRLPSVAFGDTFTTAPRSVGDPLDVTLIVTSLPASTTTLESKPVPAIATLKSTAPAPIEPGSKCPTVSAGTGGGVMTANPIANRPATATAAAPTRATVRTAEPPGRGSFRGTRVGFCRSTS